MWKKMLRIVSCFAMAATAVGQLAAAQSVTELVAQANREYEARHVPDALTHYEAALVGEPKNYAALWRAARVSLVLAEFDPDHSHQIKLFKMAEQWAHMAVQVMPGDAEGHFVLAMALGRTALSLGVRDRIKYAGEVRDQALACLKINLGHAGCLHIMGEWNAEVMRINGFNRMIAKTFLCGKVFNQASRDEAQHYLVAAVTNDPRHIIHRLALGRVYADRGMKTQARAEFHAAIDGELLEYNDPSYKAQAEKELKRL